MLSPYDDRKAAEDLINLNIKNTWKNHGAHITDEYVARLRGTFLFLPELIDLIVERMVVEHGFGRAAVPSETEMFITNRTGLGLPRISPKQLPEDESFRS